MQKCYKQIKAVNKKLDKLVPGLLSQHRHTRGWASVKAALKNKKIEKALEELEKAKSSLLQAQGASNRRLQITRLNMQREDHRLVHVQIQAFDRLGTELHAHQTILSALNGIGQLLPESRSLLQSPMNLCETLAVQLISLFAGLSIPVRRQFSMALEEALKDVTRGLAIGDNSQDSKAGPQLVIGPAEASVDNKVQHASGGQTDEEVHRPWWVKGEYKKEIHTHLGILRIYNQFVEQRTLLSELENGEQTVLTELIKYPRITFTPNWWTYWLLVSRAFRLEFDPKGDQTGWSMNWRRPKVWRPYKPPRTEE